MWSLIYQWWLWRRSPSGESFLVSVACGSCPFNSLSQQVLSLFILIGVKMSTAYDSFFDTLNNEINAGPIFHKTLHKTVWYRSVIFPMDTSIEKLLSATKSCEIWRHTSPLSSTLSSQSGLTMIGPHQLKPVMSIQNIGIEPKQQCFFWYLKWEMVEKSFFLPAKPRNYGF